MHSAGMCGPTSGPLRAREFAARHSLTVITGRDLRFQARPPRMVIQQWPRRRQTQVVLEAPD